MGESDAAKRECPRCGRENEVDATNCVRCGLDLTVSYDAPAEPAAPEAFCYRHPKTPTNLSCGRCERPICTKCAVIGPSGVRCPECARQNIPIRPGAVVHEVKRSVFQVLFASPWSLWMIITVLGFLFFSFRSCAITPRQPQRPPPVEMSEDREAE